MPVCQHPGTLLSLRGIETDRRWHGTLSAGAWAEQDQGGSNQTDHRPG